MISIKFMRLEKPDDDVPSIILQISAPPDQRGVINDVYEVVLKQNDWITVEREYRVHYNGAQKVAVIRTHVK